MITRTPSSAAVKSYISGLYRGQVASPGMTSVQDYIPQGWAEQSGLYRAIVKPFCATCHLAAPPNVSFSSWQNFQQNAALVHNTVCTSYTMPQAEMPFRELWLKNTGSVYLPGLLAASLGFPSCR
jgi:hypothetical protein